MEEYNALRRQEFREQLEAFKANDSQQRLDFPPALNAFERALIHEVAEELGGLKHESEGIAKQRHIAVTKIPDDSQE